jgi:hypothetical protein
VRIIGDIFDAGLGEQVRRIEALGQAHSQPSFRPFSGGLLDDADILFDELPLLIDAHRGKNAGVVIALTAPLPVPEVPFADDLRIFAAYIAIQIHRAAKSVLVHGLHDAPQTHPVPVVAPAVIQNVGAVLHRRRIHRVRQ